MHQSKIIKHIWWDSGGSGASNAHMMDRMGIKSRHDGDHGETTQCSWRLVATCVVQLWGGPGLWKAHKAYKGDEGRNRRHDFDYYFNLFRSIFFMWHFYARLCCLAKSAALFSTWVFPSWNPTLTHRGLRVPTLGRFLWVAIHHQELVPHSSPPYITLSLRDYAFLLDGLRGGGCF